MIITEKLTKKYSGNFIALNSIDIKTSKRITSIIGRNGAGKTTFIRILSTQLAPTSGSASINGFDILKNTREIRRSVVSIPQEASLVGIMTAYEQVKLYLVARGFSFKEAGDQANKALDELDLREFKNSPADTLSGGMKRKVFVAMALASNADVVFLDEPTTGLDPISRLEVWSAIGKIGSEVILTTHYMEEAQQLSEDLILMDHGNVIEHGKPTELLRKFDGMLRAETHEERNDCIKVGGTFIRYIKRDDAEKYISRGFTIKQINLDDLFISMGVFLES